MCLRDLLNHTLVRDKGVRLDASVLILDRTVEGILLVKGCVDDTLSLLWC